MSRRLALCADDFGMAPGVCEGIVELAGDGRLTAISCLANAGHWRDGAAMLAALSPAVEVGLHFNLTEGRAVSPDLARLWPCLPTLPRLIALAHLGRIPPAAVRAEFDAQLDAFASATGRPPDFVDGHQHVHHLPGVRGAVLDALATIHPMPAVRNTGRVLGPGYRVKRALIEATGGRALQSTLARSGIRHNAALTGVYDFADPNYRALTRSWLAAVPRDGALLFCHPAAPSGAAFADPIAAARIREYRYLRSGEFLEDLAGADLVRGPVWRLANSGG